ncbi:MAG: hypothetical protein SynsKO_28910 [Synoicihabitans sp.]
MQLGLKFKSGLKFRFDVVDYLFNKLTALRKLVRRATIIVYTQKHFKTIVKVLSVY